MKESYDISFVSDEDWYSVMCEESRSDITCLYKDILYALAAIDASKYGAYSRYWSAADKVWSALSRLPVDILVACPIRDMGIHSSRISGADYLIENYPYGGQAVEVLVKDHIIINDDFYTRVPEYLENNLNHGLLVGKDGRYYSSGVNIEYAFQYYWKNDIMGIVREIERLRKDRVMLADTTRIFDIFEFGELVDRDNDKNSIMGLDYLLCLGWMSEDEREGRCKSCHNEREPGECYAEYLYFRDKFRIVSHLTVAPEPWHRKLPVMMVDKNNDGSYFIHGDLTVKNPSFSELFYDVIKGRSTERERFVLVVDVEELLDCVQDIKYTVCGFKLLADSIEVYDGYEGMQLFGEALKEAYESGRCTVDKEFY